MAALIRPRRSVLYMPGINERAMEKAKTLDADSLILDLEDSVAPDKKQAARELVCAKVRQEDYGARELVVRINAVDTAWGADDLKAVATCGANGILIPKVNRPEDVIVAAKMLKAAGAPANLQVWAMMETPASILNASQIAAVGKGQEANLTCLVMGTNDLLKETRALSVSNRYPVLSWLSETLLAARANGLDIIDGVYNNFQNEEGLQKECEQGRALGMDGKTLIHPLQILPCNEIFSPSDKEVGWAREIIAAFKLPENADKGVITVKNQMVERLHEVTARRTVAIADAIEQKEQAAS